MSRLSRALKDLLQAEVDAEEARIAVLDARNMIKDAMAHVPENVQVLVHVYQYGAMRPYTVVRRDAEGTPVYQQMLEYADPEEAAPAPGSVREVAP